MAVQYAAVDSATTACVQLRCDAGSSCPNLLQHIHSELCNKSYYSRMQGTVG